jgi:hypothetical protein
MGRISAAASVKGEDHHGVGGASHLWASRRLLRRWLAIKSRYSAREREGELR